jgi:molybdopterin synthase catalytic subunit
MDYLFTIAEKPPDIKEIMDYMNSENAGAVYIFNGKVRNKNNSKKVIFLEYEIDEDSGKNIIKEKVRKYENKIEKLFIFQAKGKLKIGADTIIIAASSYGRKESMECVAELLEFMKHDFPVWKKEYYNDSTSEWL